MVEALTFNPQEKSFVFKTTPSNETSKPLLNIDPIFSTLSSNPEDNGFGT